MDFLEVRQLLDISSLMFVVIPAIIIYCVASGKGRFVTNQNLQSEFDKISVEKNPSDEDIDISTSIAHSDLAGNRYHSEEIN